MIKKLKRNKILGLILLIALLLRLPLLNGSFWMDEAAQALEIVRPLSQQFDIIADFQPPLLHLILHFAQYFSHSEWWLRTIGALIPGLITILFSYKLAEKLFNKNTAIVSSLLLATSSFHIFYSQELRPYSLPTMFGLMSMYYYFQLLRNESFSIQSLLPGKMRENAKNKVYLSITNLLGLYSSYLFPFLIIGQFIFTIYRDLNAQNKKIKIFNQKGFKLTKNYLGSQIIPVLGFLPWLPMFLSQLEAGGLVRKNLPGWEKVVSIPQFKAIPLVVGKFIFGNLNIELNKFFIIFGLLIIVPLILLMIHKLKENKKGNNSLIFTLSWLVLPLLISWLISFIVPVVRPKRLMYLLPALYILIAFAATNFLKKPLKKLNYALALTLLLSTFLVNIFSTISYYTDPQLQRENWKELYQDITEDFSTSNTVIIYSFTDKFSPMAWYDVQGYPSISTGKLFIDNVTDLANTLKTVVEYDNILVFDYLRDLTDPEKKIEKELTNFGFKEAGLFDYPNIGFVRIFSKPHSLIGTLNKEGHR